MADSTTEIVVVINTNSNKAMLIKNGFLSASNNRMDEAMAILAAYFNSISNAAYEKFSSLNYGSVFRKKHFKALLCVDNINNRIMITLILRYV